MLVFQPPNFQGVTFASFRQGIYANQRKPLVRMSISYSIHGISPDQPSSLSYCPPLLAVVASAFVGTSGFESAHSFSTSPWQFWQNLLSGGTAHIAYINSVLSVLLNIYIFNIYIYIYLNIYIYVNYYLLIYTFLEVSFVITNHHFLTTWSFCHLFNGPRSLLTTTVKSLYDLGSIDQSTRRMSPSPTETRGNLTLRSRCIWSYCLHFIMAGQPTPPLNVPPPKKIRPF